MLNSCGHGWPQLYDSDPVFTPIYQALCVGTPKDIHPQEVLLCHMVHFCVPSSMFANMILGAHYSHVVGKIGIEKQTVVL